MRYEAGKTMTSPSPPAWRATTWPLSRPHLACHRRAARLRRAQEIRRGELVRVLPRWMAGLATISLLTPTGRGLLPSVRAFADFLSGRQVFMGLRIGSQFAPRGTVVTALRSYDRPDELEVAAANLDVSIQICLIRSSGLNCVSDLRDRVVALPCGPQYSRTTFRCWTSLADRVQPFDRGTVS